jgi:hypothetical protein
MPTGGLLDALADQVELDRVEVHAHDFMAVTGQAGHRDRTDVTQAEDTDFHGFFAMDGAARFLRCRPLLEL